MIKIRGLLGRILISTKLCHLDEDPTSDFKSGNKYVCNPEHSLFTKAYLER